MDTVGQDGPMSCALKTSHYLLVYASLVIGLCCYKWVSG